MPKGPKGENRHADTVQNAMLIGRIATGGVETFLNRQIHYKTMGEPLSALQRDTPAVRREGQIWFLAFP